MNVFQTMPLFRRTISEREQERVILVQEVQETKQLLHRAHLQFDCIDDPDLIEAVVYEIKSLQAKYTFLIRRLKALNEEERNAAANDPC